MPLLSLTAEQAQANLRKGRRVLWPDGRYNTRRLQGLATVEFDPSFKLEAGEPVFTVGSCFARNIEKRLAKLGFEVPAASVVIPEAERGSVFGDTELLNKYGPHAMINELRWAFDPAARFPEAGYLQVGEGLWHDPHLGSSVAPASLERVRERRAMVTAFYRQLPRCRVVAITLGLAETWFDREAGLYLNRAPPNESLKREPKRFRLDLLSYPELAEALETLHGLLKAHGAPGLRVLMTVSPVPFRVTFTGQDAITANSYSKSVLRAAVEAYVRGHPEVDYFPSYEIVTHTARNLAFYTDERHVSPKVVEGIVNRMVAAYGGPALAGRDEAAEGAEPAEDAAAAPSEAARAADDLREALKAKLYRQALKLFASLDAPERLVEAGVDPFWFRYQYGRALLADDQPLQAEVQFAKAVEIDPDSANAHFASGLARDALQRIQQAEDAFRRAVELEPDNPYYQARLAHEMIRNRKPHEAEGVVLRALAAHPDDERLKSTLAAARREEALALLKLEQRVSANGWARFKALLGRMARA